jgi:hypothetical protein
MQLSTITTENGVYLQTENNELVTLFRIIKITSATKADKYVCVDVIGLDAVELGAAISFAKKYCTKHASLFFAQKYAEMVIATMLNNELCALEAFADAANQLLHAEIAAAAEADAAQYEAEQVAAENAPIDFIQVYIDGLPSDWASAEVARYCVDYFLDAELPINETITFNGKTLYLEETILDTCFAHGDSWEVWGAKDAPEKSLLMIYLQTTPIKARKKPRYPQESDYCDYRDGGDGYTSENLVLDF